MLAVLDDVLRDNREAIRILGTLPDRIARRRRIRADHVRFEYLLGNHDSLLNRYEESRRRVVEAMGLDRACIERGLPVAFPWPEVEEAARPYGVVARHGDACDILNRHPAGARGAPSIGEAITVELVNRFPEEVGAALADHPRRREIVGRLSEVDNVRPLTLIPEWVVQTAAEVGGDDPAVLRAIHRGIRTAIDAFRRSAAYADACRRSLTVWQRFYLDRVLYTLRRQDLSRVPSWRDRAVRMAGAAQSLFGRPVSRYVARALAERLPDGAVPRLVVYGHTHEARTVPLGRTADGQDRFYLNTGTWRRVWERGSTDGPAGHFAGWRVMTYVVIYAPDEGGGRTFETWTGGLGEHA
jgi:hypothetical protein